MRFSALTLLAFVSVTTAVQANNMMEVAEGLMIPRQEVSTPGSQPEASETPAPSSPNNNDNETSAPAPSSTPTAAPAPSSNRPSSNVPATSARPSQAPSSAAESSEAPETTSVPESTAIIDVRTTVITQVRTSTAADGSVTAITDEVQSVVSSTAGFAANTAAPGLNNDNNGGGDNISPRTQKIIGGVVGGVGGALLIGGLALVYLRFRKRNKSQVEIDEYPDGINEYKEGNRRDSVPLNSTPFQSNLEQYHNPPARPNAAANF